VRFLSIDVETTGLDPTRHQLVALAALLDDDRNPPRTAEQTDAATLRLLVPTWDGNYSCEDGAVALHDGTGLWAALAAARAVLVRDPPVRVQRGADHRSEVVGPAETVRWRGRDYRPTRPEDVVSILARHAYQHGTAWGPWVVAAKNPSFDLSFLRALPAEDWCRGLFHRRALDPTTAFLEDGDAEPPSLRTCAERAGLRIELHDPASECAAVASLLRRARELREAARRP
jgi:hypothetical protein